MIAATLLVPTLGAAATAATAAPADPATGNTVSLPAGATTLHVDQSQAARFFPQTETWADGSAANPFPSMAEGVRIAREHRTQGKAVHLIVAPGVYREKVEIGSVGANPPLLIESSVPGAAVITGSDVEARWTPVPGTSLHSAPWLPDWGLALVPSSWVGIHVDDLVRRREGLFVDSRPLRQVALPTALEPGTFLVDELTDQIVMAPPAGVTDLTGHLVEVTARDRALRIHGLARSVAVKGFTFEGAAPGFERHMVYVSDSTDVLIEGNRFQHSTWGGLGLASATRVTVRNNHATDNGGNGIDTYRSHDIVIEGNRIDGSNLRGHSNGHVGWSTAGSKNLLLHGAVFRNNVYDANLARGLWLDTDVKDVLIDGDRSCGNFSDGIFIEAVQGPLTIRDATFCDNTGAGIRLGTSGNVRIERSTLTGNRYAFLFTGERQRSWLDHQTGALVSIGDFADWTLVDNVLGTPGTQPLIYSPVIPIAEWRALLAAGELVASGTTFTRAPLEGSILIQNVVFPVAEWDALTGDSVLPSAPATTTTEPAPATTTTTTEPPKVSMPPPPATPQAPATRLRNRGTDFDGDRYDDIFWYGPETAPDLLSSGTRTRGRFSVSASTVAGKAKPVPGDFNGDGRDDVLWYRPGPAADVLWSGTSSRGSFTSSTVQVDGTFTPVSGDFDGDGRDDIFWYRPGTAADLLWSGTATEGSFTTSAANVAGSYRPLAGDFNGDGRSDIFWYGPGTKSDRLWSGTSTKGSFTSTATTVAGTYAPVVGDFNGDRRDDIIWYGPGAARDVLWSGSSTRGSFAATSLTVAGRYKPVSGDFNGDGEADVLWYGPGSKRDVLWSGTTTKGRFRATATNVTGTFTPVT